MEVAYLFMFTVFEPKFHFAWSEHEKTNQKIILFFFFFKKSFRFFLPGGVNM